MDGIEFIECNIKAGVAEITPELAQSILKNNNDGNRPLKKDHIKMLTDSIKRGEWMLNGESIAFSESGRLLDGQHRLTACVNSGKSFKTIVIRGIEDDSAFGTIDIGKPRSVTDLMSLKGLPKAPLFAAIAKQHKAWIETEEENRNKFTLATRKYTERNIALHGEKYKEVILPAFEAAQKLGRKSAAIGFAALLILDIAMDDGEEFFVDLESMWKNECSPEAQSPSFVLYELIQNEEHIFRPAKMTFLASVTIKAFNAHLKKEKIKKLFWQPTEGFPTVDG
jgi:hypothetical protein